MMSLPSIPFLFADRYECIEQLGVGGFSRVFLAKDHEHGGIEVAIKIYQAPDLSAFDEEQKEVLRRTRRRFCQEANILFQLDSPYIVRAFRTGVSREDLPFIVMEYIKGETLKQRLRRGPVALREVLSWVKMMLEGLREAHQQGILHRDLTPRNMMLTRVDGEIEVKIIDFGIARSESTFANGAWTQIGTPLYSSPEQLTGTPLTFASDVYAVGLLLHKMLLGSVPHTNHSGRSVLLYSRAYEEVPSPKASGHFLETTLEAFLMKALAREPDKRFSSCGAMLDAFLPIYQRHCEEAHETDPGEATMLDPHPPVASMVTWAKMHQISCVLQQEDKTTVNPSSSPKIALRPKAISQAQVATRILFAPEQNEGSQTASHRAQPIRVERSRQPRTTTSQVVMRAKRGHGLWQRLWSFFTAAILGPRSNDRVASSAKS